MRSINIFWLLLFLLNCEFITSAQQIDSLQNITIYVTFASPPSSFTVNKAPLRYNKSFAYSFQIDDGGKDIYSLGFPLFQGGSIGSTTYPGLKFTDGCGNDKTFKMSSSLFSFSNYGGSEIDMHDPNGAYATLNITWPEIAVMLQNDWGISNHGLTSSTAGNVEYDIARNHSYVKLKTLSSMNGGDDMGIFVNPNGEEAYTAPAFAQGYLACYRVGNTFGDPSVDVTTAWSHSNIRMGRTGVGNSANLPALVDAMASASVGGAHHWGVHFTHSIENGNWGYDFATFQSVMNYVTDTYGKNGLDNIWMATEEEVLDYLLVKDAITVNTQLTGSVLKITYSGAIPSSYRYYNNSILINADQPVLSVTATGVTGISFNGAGTNSSLINITWNGRYITPPEVNAETWVSKTETTHSQYDANVAMDYVLMVPAGAAQQAFRLRLCTITGITMPASFCNMRNAPITSVPAISVCPDNLIPFPVLVNGFTNITSVSLRIEYDPAVITFVSGTAGKPDVLTGMQITSAPVGSGSALNKIMITWSGSTPKSLAASDTLAKLIFNNITGSSPIVFNTESGSSGDCEYKDENSNVMIDFPSSTYYLNGQIAFSGLPAPGLISGSAELCPGTTGHVYTVPAVAGATSYAWTYPQGFTPVSGQNTNAIILSALAAAVSGNITVKAVNMCNNNPFSQPFLVTVKPRPVPTITGLASLCAATSNIAYSTESGMSNYVWTISSGGAITAGTGTNAILVSWSASGTQFINVSYTALNGCAATEPTVKTVTVNARPIPTISGGSTGCLNGQSTFSTETGMSSYSWTVSSGGTIVSGGNTSFVTINWSSIGAKTVSVNYINQNGCIAVNPTVKSIMVSMPPVPVITGSSSVCEGSANLFYSTDAGMTNYTWAVSGGGAITSGQGTNAVTISWYTVGSETVSVLYTNPSGCTSVVPSVKNVVVHPLPVPTLSGADSVCKGTVGAIYITEPGMADYQWTISPGGVITSGSNSHMILVNWTIAGSQVLTVNYTNSTGCAASFPAVLNVMVKSLPAPSISGIDTICVNETTTYATDTGMTNYQWAVSSGGTIVSGEGTSMIQVQWTDSGSKMLYVNYMNSAGCTASIPASMTVSVFPLPVPTLTGPQLVCEGSAGINYSTEAGMTDYQWTISPGGVITAGALTNIITVTWNLPGMQSIVVGYTNEHGCMVAAPVSMNVSVLPFSVPSITGYDSVCVNQLAAYQTESGMSAYQWTIGEGGNLISGAGTNFIHVLWTSVGTKSVTVTYTNPAGCTTTTPGLKTVTVAHLNPSIIGETEVCEGITGVVYTTQPGMSNYAWSVTSGGAITSGYGTNSIIVSWNSQGMQAVSVNYSNAFGCTAPSPVNLQVTVHPVIVPSVNGSTMVCVNSGNYPYTTQPGMINYLWSLSSGGIITSGQGTNSILVNWTSSGAHSVIVSFSHVNGCVSATPGILPVTVNSGPPNPGPVAGETLICKPRNNVVYSVTPVPLATGYLWNLPPGTVITSGANTNIITVNFNATAQSGDVAVVCTNSCGPGTFSPPLAVSVYPYPATPVISLESPDTLVSSASTGNQWYYENQAIPGANGKRQVVNHSGHYFVLVNPFGCTSDTSNIINAVAVGIGAQHNFNLSIYPNPGNGKVTIRLSADREKKNLTIRVLDLLGKEIFVLPEQLVSGEIKMELDLGAQPTGIYTMILRVGTAQIERKLVIEK